MKVEVTNIPKDKFAKVQNEILKVVLSNGLEEIETIKAEEDLNCEFQGFELEINIHKSDIPAVVSSSAGG